MITIQPKLKPNAPDEQYSRLVEIRREISRYQTSPAGMHPSDGLVRFVVTSMDTLIGRENRNKFLSECFMREIKSSKDLTAGEAMGLLLWAAPVKDAVSAGEKERWHFTARYKHDMQLIQGHFGQLEFTQKENL